VAPDVPIKVIGTMQGEKQGDWCCNKGHWNNRGGEKKHSFVLLRVYLKIMMRTLGILA